VNNVTGPTTALDVLSATDADWLAGYTMNVLVHVRFIRRALPGMLERGWGRIVNVSSTAGRQPDEQLPTYTASKAALINLSKLLANAYSRSGVLTNCVLPRITRTEAATASAIRRTGRTADDPRRSSTSTSARAGRCPRAASASPRTSPRWSRCSAPIAPPG
jgi:NAD(P)-dependent dehydrogenase (short-subunit alcohol dehydrogenase family)